MYINSIQIRKFRSALANFRCGTLPLEIETGRMCRVDRLERLCKVCKSGEIEDEVHFLLICKPLQHIREQYLNVSSTSLQTFFNLLSYKNEDVIRNVAMYIYHAMSFRNVVLLT